MDFTALLSTIGPQAGVGGVLLALLIVATRNAATDRGDYRSALSSAEARHAAELARRDAAHDTELTEARERADAQEKRAAELSARLDEERRRRWEAEDAAAQARRKGTR